MRRIREFSRELLSAWRWLSRRFYNGVVFVGRWLDLQHVTALLMTYFALLFVRQTPVAISEALALLGLQATYFNPVFAFAFCAGALIGKPISSLWYRFWTLPLATYGLIFWWYSTTNNGIGATTAGFGIGLWAILQVMVTVPRQGGIPDADRSE